MTTLSNRRGLPDLEGNMGSSLPYSPDENKKNRAISSGGRMKLSRILRYSLAPAIFLFGSMTFFVPNFKGYNPVSIHCLCGVVDDDDEMHCSRDRAWTDRTSFSRSPKEGIEHLTLFRKRESKPKNGQPLKRG